MNFRHLALKGHLFCLIAIETSHFQPFGIECKPIIWVLKLFSFQFQYNLVPEHARPVRRLGLANPNLRTGMLWVRDWFQ